MTRLNIANIQMLALKMIVGSTKPPESEAPPSEDDPDLDDAILCAVFWQTAEIVKEYNRSKLNSPAQQHAVMRAIAQSMQNRPSDELINLMLWALKDTGNTSE